VPSVPQSLRTTCDPCAMASKEYSGGLPLFCSRGCGASEWRDSALICSCRVFLSASCIASWAGRSAFSSVVSSSLTRSGLTA
jgi:hypothetical protein